MVKEIELNDFQRIWFSNWVRMPYEILDKTTMQKKRREMLSGVNDDFKLELPYEKYISSPFKVTEGEIIDPFNPSRFFDTDKPPYLDLLELNTKDEKSILNFVNRFGLLGIIYHNYRYLDINYNVHLSTQTMNSFDKNRYSKWHRYINNFESVYPMTEDKIEALKKNNKLLSGDIEQLILNYVFDKASNEHYEIMKLIDMNNMFSPLNRNPYETEPHNLIEQELNHIELLHSIIYKYDDNSSSNSIKNIKGAFAQLYTEPLDLFIKEVNNFKNLYNLISRIEEKEHGWERDILLLNIYVLLSKNMKSINPKPMIDISARILTFGWEVPSLISAYYLMLYLDLTKKLHMRLCKNQKCKKPIVTIRQDKEYCGLKCRDLVRKQKQLDREKNFKNEIQQARLKYKPDKIQFLLIAEHDRNVTTNDYFYITNHQEKDNLFADTIRALFPDNYKGLKNIHKDKEILLMKLKEKGIYMIDASKQNRQNKIVLPTVIRNVKEISDRATTKIIVVSDNSYQDISAYVKNKGYNVINKETIEFPYGETNRELYKSKIRILLIDNGIDL